MIQNVNTICCLNPDCTNPLNLLDTKICQSCGTDIRTLRHHYHPVKLLSDEGGFGRTYLAIDLDKLNRECVIKQLAPQVQGTGALKKATELFEQEARQLEELGENPQIPSLLAYFEENAYLYLVQQYIKGKTLDKLPNQGVWSEQEVKDFFLNILPVLVLIHSKNIIHRDLKPSNIIKRDDNGNYVLIDFGASKELATRIASRATQIGTYGYSAREQIIEGRAYPASDLFSLGVVGFYLLTKKDPSVLYVDEGYRWLENWESYLSQPLSFEFKQVLSKLLQREVRNRYSSAQEVLTALQSPSLGSPVIPKSTVISSPQVEKSLTSTPPVKPSSPDKSTQSCKLTLKEWLAKDLARKYLSVSEQQREYEKYLNSSNSQTEKTEIKTSNILTFEEWLQKDLSFKYFPISEQKKQYQKYLNSKRNK